MAGKSDDKMELRSFTFKDEDESQEVHAVERRALLETLSAQLPSDTIQFSSKLAKTERTKDGETMLKLSGGTQITAKSPLAKWMDFSEPKYVWHCASWGLGHYSGGHQLEPGVNDIYGRRMQTRYVPVSPTKVYWFICFNSSSPGPKITDPNVLKKKATELVSHWPSELLKIIGNSSAETVSKTPLVDCWLWPILSPPALYGRVVLVGDAWQPMTPNPRQGACCALQGAVALAMKIPGTIKSGDDATMEDMFR